jgi:hypothetical protein
VRFDINLAEVVIKLIGLPTLNCIINCILLGTSLFSRDSPSFTGLFTYVSETQAFKNCWRNLVSIEFRCKPLFLNAQTSSSHFLNILKHNESKLSLNLLCAPRIKSRIEPDYGLVLE